MNFWCFSFERFNGIIGNEPTNNKSIEVQLMKQFLSDNSNLELLSLGEVLFKDSDVSNVFKEVVLTHAQMQDSLQHHHLDDLFKY